MRIHTLRAGIAVALPLFVFLHGPVRADVVIDGGGSFVTLLGVNANSSGVVFDAREPGAMCDFTYHIQRFGEGPALLALIREGGQPCRGKLRIRATVAFSYEELGLEVGDTFQVLNPIEANDLPAEAELGRVPRSHTRRPR